MRFCTFVLLVLVVLLLSDQCHCNALPYDLGMCLCLRIFIISLQNWKKFLALRYNVLWSTVPSFNSIHDTLQEKWAIEKPTSFTPECPWDMVTSGVNQPINKVQYLFFIVFNGCAASGHCMHITSHTQHALKCMFVS